MTVLQYEIPLPLFAVSDFRITIRRVLPVNCEKVIRNCANWSWGLDEGTEVFFFLRIRVFCWWVCVHVCVCDTFSVCVRATVFVSARLRVCVSWLNLKLK